MSDARAKAEARRAKILARESSMKVHAISGDITLPVEGVTQERPLAKRRNFVKAVSEKSLTADEPSTPTRSDAEEESASKDVTPVKGTETQEGKEGGSKKDTAKVKAPPSNVDDPEVESIAELEEKHNDDSPSPSPAPAKTADNADGRKELLKKLSPKKTLKEIEEEVARNTAKYDADTMSGEKDESKGPKRAKPTKEAVMKSKAAKVSASNINPTNITRLIRMFVIIALGTYKGYTVVQSNIAARDNSMIRAMEAGAAFSSAGQPVAFDEFGDPIVGATAETYVDEQQQTGSQSQGQGKPSRTWGEWVQYKVTAPFESTLTAVGVSYWIANMLSAGINSRLKSAPKPKGILEQVMALYQSGFEGVLERVFCLLGEYALHLGTIVLVVTALTLFTEVPTAHIASTVAEVVSGVDAPSATGEL